MAEFGKWIAVEDELPKDGDYSVLVAFTNGSVEPIQMWHVQDWLRAENRDPRLHVTHWMPMPAHPADQAK